MQRIIEDFDRIALLSERETTASAGADLYHDFLLRQVPKRIEKALEVGCGTGTFTRMLSSRAQHVTALDISPQMIRIAKSQTAAANINYELADVMTRSLPPCEFDCIVSLATLHHVPFPEAVIKLQAALKSGGILILHDVLRNAGVFGFGLNAVAFPLSLIRRFVKTGHFMAPVEVRQAWRAHGQNETYLTIKQVREMCRHFLPGARIIRHLLWRYTVVWNKPTDR